MNEDIVTSEGVCYVYTYNPLPPTHLIKYQCVYKGYRLSHKKAS